MKEEKGIDASRVSDLQTGGVSMSSQDSVADTVITYDITKAEGYDSGVISNKKVLSPSTQLPFLKF
jgi:hypothetical protein